VGPAVPEARRREFLVPDLGYPRAHRAGTTRAVCGARNVYGSPHGGRRHPDATRTRAHGPAREDARGRAQRPRLTPARAVSRGQLVRYGAKAGPHAAGKPGATIDRRARTAGGFAPQLRPPARRARGRRGGPRPWWRGWARYRADPHAPAVAGRTDDALQRHRGF